MSSQRLCCLICLIAKIKILICCHCKELVVNFCHRKDVILNYPVLCFLYSTLVSLLLQQEIVDRSPVFSVPTSPASDCGLCTSLRCLFFSRNCGPWTSLQCLYFSRKRLWTIPEVNKGRNVQKEVQFLKCITKFCSMNSTNFNWFYWRWFNYLFRQ